jgi:flagellar protein FlgJ
MATPVNNTLYSDFGSLEALKKNVRQDDSSAVRKAAQQFESLFTNMLLKSMREATQNTNPGEQSIDGSDSEGTQFYQGMFDQQLAVNLSQGKGLGLADMLVKQLTKTGLAHGAAKGAAISPAAMSAPPSSPTSTLTPPTSLATPATATPVAATANTNSPLIEPSLTPEADFVRRIQPAAQVVAARLGVAPEAVIAHAALETGWGQHQPTDARGSQSNNLFGIKAGSSWNGAAVQAGTTEFAAGVAARKTGSFRAYGTEADGLNDYASMLQGSPRYAAALGTGSDVAAFARGLQRGGYATDPNYARKLTAVAENVRSLMNSPSLKTET